MTIRDLLPTMGITSDMIEDAFGCLDHNIDKGYAIRKMPIKTGRAIQAITIYPFIMWTDGTCRPDYVYLWAEVCVNKVI